VVVVVEVHEKTIKSPVLTYNKWDAEPMLASIGTGTRLQCIIYHNDVSEAEPDDNQFVL